MHSQNGFRIFLTIIVSFILLTGAFSGGVVTGWLLPLHASKAQAPAPVVEQAAPATAVPAPTSLPTLPQAQPTETGQPILPENQPTETPPGLQSAGPTLEPTGSAPSGSQDLNALFDPFWQAWQLVHQQYVDQPLNNEQLMQGAIRGMLDSLGDQHTSYMDPGQYQAENNDLQGNYEGIGAWVDATGKGLGIISPMPGSPAEKAGLKAGDKVTAVDGKDVTGLDGNQVISKILGPAGTKVTLTIQRNGVDKPFDVVIVRASITVPSVTGKMLDHNIAYIQLLIFGQTTGDDLKKTLTDLMAKKPTGLILDLRNNGGGYLDTAIQVASQFIPDTAGNIVVSEKYADGSQKSSAVLPGGLATQIPMIVLVNAGTASASEIVSGAVQDYGRGKLVGVKTYGKGSVQLVSELHNNEGAVRITIAHWLTPKGRQIDKIGLQPDVEVQLTDADANAKKDPQLDKAVQLLLSQP